MKEIQVWGGTGGQIPTGGYPIYSENGLSQCHSMRNTPWGLRGTKPGSLRREGDILV
jgi:hypothetical protein